MIIYITYHLLREAGNSDMPRLHDSHDTVPPRFPALFHLVPFAVFGETEGEGVALVLGQWNQNLLSYYPETNNPKIFVVENQKISFRTGDPIKRPSIVNPQVSIQPVRYLWMDFKYGYVGSWVNICVYVKFPGGGRYPFVPILYLLSAVCITHKTLITTVWIYATRKNHCLLFHRVHW